MMHHLKGLLFDCLSFTGSLITALSFANRGARSNFNIYHTTSLLTINAL